MKAPARLGYRQRALLAALEAADREVPLGFLLRACALDAKTACMALRLLEGRGLVAHPRHGWYVAA